LIVKPAVFLFIASLLLSACQDAQPARDVQPAPVPAIAFQSFIYPPIVLDDAHLTELQRCDILVKPNLCIFPGMLHLPGGVLLGHAAIVIEGAIDTGEVELMRKAVLFESQARDVPGPYQLRLTPGYAPGDDYSYANYSFGPEMLGDLYRLRLDLSEVQKDSIIAWILDKDEDLSSYRACKDFGSSPGKPSEYWYCSLLIWQAFYNVLGIDLDADQGLYVYPNDLVYSKYFDEEPGKNVKRVRF
jgi:hypothetical protein